MIFAFVILEPQAKNLIVTHVFNNDSRCFVPHHDKWESLYSCGKLLNDRSNPQFSIFNFFQESTADNS